MQALFPNNNKGKNVYFQGSRQMTSTSRRYYEMELGAGVGPSPGFTEMFGYSEPLRRFIQREGFEPQANEIPNTMPSWMPGDDYYTNFRKGDPFVKVDDGYARLPGAGYEALHPEVEGTNPEDYPDINKMAILADVAPYSREYNTRSLRPAQPQNPRVCAGRKAARYAHSLSVHHAGSRPFGGRGDRGWAFLAGYVPVSEGTYAVPTGIRSKGLGPQRSTVPTSCIVSVNEGSPDSTQLHLVGTKIYFDRSTGSFWLKLTAENSASHK